MQMSIGLDRLKRFVCLLLIFVLLFCFFMCPRASAVALEATTIAYGGLLVGTILVGAGVVFSSHGDMVKVGNAMYKTLVNGSSAIGKTISSISAWAVEHGTSLAKGALRVGKDLYQAVVDAFNASYSNGFFSDGAHVSFSVDASDDDCKSFASVLVGWVKEGRSFTVYTTGPYSDAIIRQDFIPSFDADGTFQLEVDTDGEPRYYGGFVPARWSYDGVYASSYEYMQASFTVYNSGGGGQSFAFNRQAVASLGNLVSAPADDLAYPSDDYLVKMPDIPSVDTATGEVTYPDSIAYTKDAVAAPYPIGDDGVKVPDIPFDIPVDQTSGKPMEDTGTDTDTPSKPGEGTDTDKPSDSVNWPSAGDISLPKLIISKFPFCIPFDVARLIGLLEADPKTPVFHVPLKVGTILDEEIVLDLSQWDNAVRIIRWGELIVFVAGLVLVTRNYIKW
jgi:hypothetical protein